MYCGDYEPLHRNRRERLEELITGDGRPLPECLKAQISRELDRLELVIEQVKAVEAERDALLAQVQASPGVPAPAALLLALKGIGPEAAATLWSEAFRSSATESRLPPMPDWPPRRGKADGPSGPGRLQGRQSPAANDHDPDCLAVAAASAEVSAGVWFRERIKRTGGRARRRSLRWRASCWSRSGSMQQLAF